MADTERDVAALAANALQLREQDPHAIVDRGVEARLAIVWRARGATASRAMPAISATFARSRRSWIAPAAITRARAPLMSRSRKATIACASRRRNRARRASRPVCTRLRSSRRRTRARSHSRSGRRRRSRARRRRGRAAARARAPPRPAAPRWSGRGCRRARPGARRGRSRILRRTTPAPARTPAGTASAAALSARVGTAPSAIAISAASGSSARSDGKGPMRCASSGAGVACRRSPRREPGAAIGGAQLDVVRRIETLDLVALEQRRLDQARCLDGAHVVNLGQ